MTPFVVARGGSLRSTGADETAIEPSGRSDRR
jgi:hypothetical protein